MADLIAQFLVLLAAPVLGYLAGAYRALAMHRLTLGLQLRVKDIEDRLIREDKRFAGTQRWTKKIEEEKLLAATMEAAKNRKAEEPAPWALF